MRSLLPVALSLALGGALAAGCGEERQSYVPNVGDGNTTPTMTTADVSTFISDSGYTRYHITAPVWQMFEEAKDPFWRFPYGLDLEQYDLQMKPQSNIRSDSATYFSRRRIWRLDGHVVMVNIDGDSFLTQQLFWDQQQRKVYSDSFIHIVRTDRVIEGYGFTSNENMTEYIVNRPTGIIPVNRDEETARTTPADSATTDSVAEKTKSKRTAPTRASRRATDSADSTHGKPQSPASDPSKLSKTSIITTNR